MALRSLLVLALVLQTPLAMAGSDSLDVTIHPTTIQATVGSEVHIYLRIKNTSSVPQYVFKHYEVGWNYAIIGPQSHWVYPFFDPVFISSIPCGKRYKYVIKIPPGASIEHEYTLKLKGINITSPGMYQLRSSYYGQRTTKPSLYCLNNHDVSVELPSVIISVSGSEHHVPAAN